MSFVIENSPSQSRNVTIINSSNKENTAARAKGSKVGNSESVGPSAKRKKKETDADSKLLETIQSLVAAPPDSSPLKKKSTH